MKTGPETLTVTDVPFHLTASTISGPAMNSLPFGENDGEVFAYEDV